MALASTLVVRSPWLLERTLQVNGSTVGSFPGGRLFQRLKVALRHWSWRKFFNFWSIEVQFRLGRTKVWGLPYEWEVDTTNICQLKCPLCHTGLGNINRDKGTMHFDDYTKVVDQIKSHCIWPSLYSWGEPFLNKDIDRFVAYANKANIATMISSNLNKPLTPAMAESLIRSGLDVLIVSLDGTTQDVYEVYRVGGRLERVLENVSLLVQKKRELNSSSPYIEWQFIVMRQNEHQVAEARRLSRELGVDNIVFKKVDFPHGETDRELAQRWLPRAAEDFRREQPFDKPYAESGKRCWRLWRSAVVNWDGGYAPCCYLTDAKDDCGSVNTHPLKDIWNNAHYRSARDLFNGATATTENVGCLNCSVYLESKAAKNRSHPVQIHRNGTGPSVARTEIEAVPEKSSSRMG